MACKNGLFSIRPFCTTRKRWIGMRIKHRQMLQTIQIMISTETTPGVEMLTFLSK